MKIEPVCVCVLCVCLSGDICLALVLDVISESMEGACNI